MFCSISFDLCFSNSSDLLLYRIFHQPRRSVIISSVHAFVIVLILVPCWTFIYSAALLKSSIFSQIKPSLIFFLPKVIHLPNCANVFVNSDFFDLLFLLLAVVFKIFFLGNVFLAASNILLLIISHISSSSCTDLSAYSELPFSVLCIRFLFLNILFNSSLYFSQSSLNAFSLVQTF